MKRNEWSKPMAAALAMALMAAAGTHAAQPQGQPQAQPQPAEAPGADFAKLDVNRDGRLDRSEVKSLTGFDKAFAEADDNRDGMLDPAEFAKAQAVFERQRAAQFLDDSVITAKVKAALLKDPVVSGISVSVETHNGTVLLSGFVNSQQQQKRAAELAAAVGGVQTVKNALVVKG